MFSGRRRAQAIEATLAALNTSLRPYTHIHGEPAHFWLDPFVLGYVSGLTGVVTAAVFAPKRPTHEDIGQVLSEVLAKASRLNPRAMNEIYLEVANSQDASFRYGATIAAKIFLFSAGKLPNEYADPDISEAFALAEKMGNTDRQTVSAALYMKMVIPELRHRFGSETE